MSFWERLTPISLAINLFKLAMPTGLNILLINFASARAIEQGDTDWLSAIILMVTMLGSVAILLDAIKTCRAQWVWQNLLYLIASGFNVFYFFKILICCVPVVGDL